MKLDLSFFQRNNFVLNRNFTLDVSEFPLWNLSYSLYGEDLILRGLLKQKLREGQPGFYVDLGCCDPRQASNSYLFYRYGWRGVCIDANSEFKEAFAAIRPRDTFVNALVGEAGRYFWAECKSNLGMSRIATAPEQFGDDYEAPVAMNALPLREILDRHVPAGTQIDFMSVDLEDSELGAFSSSDWKKYRPSFMLVETHGIELQNTNTSPVLNFLRDQGYALTGIASGNAILADNRG